MTTLLGPAVVLVATIATLRIALGLDQTATTPTPSRRAPDPAVGPPPVADRADRADRTERADRTDRAERADRAQRADRSRGSAPVTMTHAMPAGFDWTDATPVPRLRSGFALIVILAVIGALLAMAVAGLVLGATVVFKGL